MDNPYYKSKPLRERDCYSCEDIIEIERRDQIQSEIIAEKYIKSGIPVIIGSNIMRTVVKSWPIGSHTFGLDDIEKVILISN